MNGPTHTGCWAKFVPSAASAFGDMTMPARSASCESSGEYGVERCRTTVLEPWVETDLIGEISLARTDPFKVRSRSIDVFTAAAFSAVPSLNLIPLRILIV